MRAPARPVLNHRIRPARPRSFRPPVRELTIMQSHAVARSLPARHRLCLLIGVLASFFFFTATYLVAGMLRPGYSTLRQPISALSLGPGGWVQSANFIVFGVALAVSVVGWRAVLQPGLGSLLIPVLKLGTAVALIVDGLFSQDPANGYHPDVAAPAATTMHGIIHTMGAVIAVLTLVVADFVFAARFAQEPGWRLWVPIAAVAGILTLVFIALFGASTGHGPAGLYERLGTGINSLFTLALVTRLLRGSGYVASD